MHLPAFSNLSIIRFSSMTSATNHAHFLSNTLSPPFTKLLAEILFVIVKEFYAFLYYNEPECNVAKSTYMV